MTSDLAERAWTTSDAGSHVLLRDIDRTEVNVAQGRAIVAEHFSVPEEVRRRRRTGKTSGKAPQVLSARVKSVSRGDDRRIGPKVLGESTASASMRRGRGTTCSFTTSLARRDQQFPWDIP